MTDLSKFNAWREKRRQLVQAQAWLKHIGAAGRVFRGGQDFLHLSEAHCQAPRFTVAGQYSEGGTNYWESPGAFNSAMTTVILANWKHLASEAERLMERRAAEALVEAEAEIREIVGALEAAKAILPVARCEDAASPTVDPKGGP